MAAATTNPTTGADLLAAALAANGIERIFVAAGAVPAAIQRCLCAGSIAAIATATPASAAVMAMAAGRLCGRPGLALVEGRAGLLAAAVVLDAAARDAAPMLLLVVPAPGDRRLDEPVAIAAPAAGRAMAIDGAARIAPALGRAVRLATSGRAGPVTIFLPEVLTAPVAAPVGAAPVASIETHPGAARMWDLQKRLWAAKRPLAIVGGGRWSAEAMRRFARFVDKFDLPIVCARGCRDLFDHDDPHFVGALGRDLDPALAARLGAVDLLLTVGCDAADLAGLATGLPPDRTSVEVHPDLAELGRLRPAELEIHASPAAFAAAAEALEPPPAGVAWGDWRAAARADRLAWTAPEEGVPAAGVLARLSEDLPAETIAVTAADGLAADVERFWRLGRDRRELTCVGGHALAAAIAAALAHPDRPVVTVTGADDFLRATPDLGVAVRERATLVAVVFAEAGAAPDVAMLARAWGAAAATAAGTEAVLAAVRAGLANAGPTVVVVMPAG